MDNEKFLNSLERLNQEFERKGNGMTRAQYLAQRTISKGYTFEDAFFMYVYFVKEDGLQITMKHPNSKPMII